MNREDIIKLAREAGFKVDWQHADVAEIKAKRYEYFAALVAAHEREACAKVCDVLAVHPEYASDITKVAAQAIRARSEK